MEQGAVGSAKAVVDQTGHEIVYHALQAETDTDGGQPMSDDLNKRLATLNALLELKEAVAQDDLKAAQDCRDKRLILALDLFSADRKRHDALQQVFDVTGGWVRGVGRANTVREALKRAIPLFEH